MTDESLQFLTGLAQDVLEHSGCEGCKINAANGLEARGLLEDVLRRAGIPDPRPRHGPFKPTHSPRPPLTPRPDVRASLQVIVTYSLPGEATEEDARRRAREVAEDVKAAVVANNGVVSAISSRGSRRPGGG